MLITSIQFHLLCIYPCLIFRKSVIYAYYFYPIWLILHLLLACQSFMLITSIQFGLFCIYFYLIFLAGQSSILVTSIQFSLFCIYSCLIFSRSVIYTCYFYPIWLILHLFLPYFFFVFFIYF